VTDRAGNVLGALALSIADRTAEAIEASAGHSHSAAIALSALDQFLERPTVDRLKTVLGLTQSGAVRLVDRLEADGLVTREPGTDNRSKAITLTAAGRKAAQRVAAARDEVLENALAGLSPDERATFDELLARVVIRQIRGPGATGWLCRLCDMEACGRDAGRCPVATEAKRRYAQTRSAADDSAASR
jgi:DNA-binding MarR family transcriptional regulator